MPQNCQDPPVSTNSHYGYQSQAPRQPNRFTSHLIDYLLNQSPPPSAHNQSGQQSSQMTGQLFDPDRSGHGNE